MKNKLLKIRHNLTAFKLLKCILRSLPQGIKTSKWLLTLTVPVSFAVLLLDYSGGLEIIAKFTTPFFQYLGLPGVAAIVLITSIFTNIYSVIAVLAILGTDTRRYNYCGNVFNFTRFCY